MLEIVQQGTVSNQSTEKAMAMLEFMSQQCEALRLSDISRALGINGSTALRFLTALERCGYIYQDAVTLRYRITMKLCNLAHDVAAHNSIGDIAAPYIRRISDRFGALGCLSVEQNMEVVYIGTCDSRKSILKPLIYIGKTAPMHCTGTGKLFLSDRSEVQLLEFYNSKGLPRLTENTIVDMEALRCELAQIRVRGYALDREECEDGMQCIAAPVRDFTGRIVAGISVTTSTHYIQSIPSGDDIAVLCATAAELSTLLGYQNRE